MMKVRIGALLAAAAVVLTFAGTALADGSLDWNGTNGWPVKDNCTNSQPGEMLWIFTGDSAADVVLTMNGSTYTGVQQGKGTWQIVTPYVTSAPTASAAWTGDFANTNATLTISHGCAPTIESPSASASESPSASASESPSASLPEDTSSPSASASASSTPTSSIEGVTGTPKVTPPSTDSLGNSGSSTPSGLPIVLAVVAGLLAAALVVTPRRARR